MNITALKTAGGVAVATCCVVLIYCAFVRLALPDEFEEQWADPGPLVVSPETLSASGIETTGLLLGKQQLSSSNVTGLTKNDLEAIWALHIDRDLPIPDGALSKLAEAAYSSRHPRLPLRTALVGSLAIGVLGVGLLTAARRRTPQQTTPTT
jgi:hypothetical protein